MRSLGGVPTARFLAWGVFAFLVLPVCAQSRPELGERIAERWRWRGVGLPDEESRVERVSFDGRGRILAWFDGALHRYDGAWETLPLELEFRGGAPDWMVPFDQGVALADSRRLVRLSEDSTPLTLSVAGPAEAPLRGLHALADGSVACVRGTTLTRFRGQLVEVRELPSEVPLQGIEVDATGRLWATTGYELFRSRGANAWEAIDLDALEHPVPALGPIARAGEQLLFLPLHTRSERHHLLWNGADLVQSVGPPLMRGAIGLGSTFLVYGRTTRLHVSTGTEWGRAVRPPQVRSWIERALWSPRSERLLMRSAEGTLLTCELGSRRWSVTPLGPPGSDANRVLALAQGAEGLWVGSQRGVRRVVDGRVVESFDKVLGRELEVITALHEDESGRLWVGSGASFAGVLVREDGEWRHLGEGPLADCCVHGIRADDEGRLWFLMLSGTWVMRSHKGGGVACLETDGRLRFWNQEDGLPGSRTYDLVQTPRGLHLGTNLGVARREGEGWRALPELAGTGTRELHWDSSGTLWASGGMIAPGLHRSRAGVVLPAHPMDAELVAASFADAPRGGVWIAGLQGLYLHDGQDLHPTFQEPGTPNMGYTCMLPDGEGGLWLGSDSSGLVQYRPEDEEAPHLHTLSWAQQGERLLARWEAVDPWSATPTPALRYSWRVDGGTWSPLTRLEQIEIADLEVGEHRLEVRAVDRAGNRSNVVARTIEVAGPPPGRAPWFALLGASLLAAAFAGLGALQFRARRRQAKQSRRRLRANDLHYRELVEGAGLQHALLGAEGEGLQLSEELQRLCGSAPDRAQLTRALAGEDAQQRAALLRALDPQSPSEFHGELATTDARGQRLWHWVSLAPRLDLAGAAHGFDLVALDLTRAKAAQEERRRVEEWHRDSQKMEALGRLALNVAHDFNNLLTVISGNAELMFSANAHEEEKRHAILAASARAANLTRDLLAIGREQQLRPSVVTLAGVLHDLAPLLRRMTPEGVMFELRADTELAPVEVDVSQLERVVLNLAHNACQAMPQGGVLRVSASDEPERVVLCVEDSGVGMDAETQSRVLEPFFTTRREQGGTGIGLAMVQGIVRQSGGELEIQSQPGIGTSVRVRLPKSDQVPRAPLQPTPAASGRGELVLLCEDDPAVQHFAQVALESNGFRVHCAKSADEAKDWLEREERPALLVTDLSLPGSSGLVLARAVQLRWPGLPVLLCSGYAPSAIGEELGELPFLAKPFRMADLLRAARDAIDATQAPDDAPARQA